MRCVQNHSTKKGKGNSFAPVSVAAIAIMAAMSFNAMCYTVTSKDSVADGVIFTMSNNAKMKVQVCTDKIIRIVYTMRSAIPRADSNYIVVKGTWAPVSWTVSQNSTAYSVQTATLRADVAIATGAVSFYAGGALILQETAGKTLNQKTVSSYTAYEGTIPFDQTINNEGIYGFGQLQNLPYNMPFNLRGQSLNLYQLNETDVSPFFMSTRGFGVLWVNYSKMTVNAPLTLWCNWATNDAIDYYFIYGPEFDPIIAAYRTITGPAPLWPKWAYGFWQCKNRYQSQSEIISTIQQYRSNGYPIDNIVQDWLYYPDGGNGSSSFDAGRYPDPAGMIRTLHDSLHCHFTISVWPSFASTCGPNYDFMSSHGYLINSNDFLGTTYDAFNDSAAHYYWKFINDSLVSKGVDAFWPDATEPEYENQWVTATTAQGPAEKVENIFPLLHSKTLYDGYRAATAGKKRVCNLTRSYYAGSQRFAAAYWTGDINTDFGTYTQQIPAGLDFCMTGMPLFCTDVGGFWGDVTADNMTRWFEWGAFNPVFRVHGTRACNEIWCWGTTTEQILVKYSKLRYRLFPYIYSLAWKVTSEGYTIMRGLPFDYRTDATVRDVSNEFMFGPAFLVCPVTSQAADVTRAVYLPAGGWFDFWTGASLSGGETVPNADAPLDKIPLYIRAGSIVPMGPEISYADTAADPIELRVYTGTDGSFNLYEDEGDGYDYEKGAYATIPITWNEATQILSIGPTSGSFPGIQTKRTFNVVWVSQNHGVGGTVTTAIDKAISYTGGGIHLDKATGQIGVIAQATTRSPVLFLSRLSGRSYIVSVKGKEAVRVSLSDPLGRIVAAGKVAGNSSSVVAQRLASGMYIVHFMYGSNRVATRTIVVP